MEDDRLLQNMTIPLVAKGYPSIVFQSTRNKRRDAVAQLVLYGQNVRPFQLDASGDLLVIAYFLHPYLVKYFFDFNAREIKDLCIDIGVMRPAKSMNLVEQLVNARSLPARIQLMNDYVRKLSATSRGQDDKAIIWSTLEIVKNRGLVSLKTLQSELCITERTFQRLFESHIGVPPKLFRKICQFNAAFDQFSKGHYNRLTDIAYDHGYSDQSHFIRVFKEFTLLTPGDYLKRLPGN
ncbi:helix-turn-helix domain-containing protein [Flavitalea sp. BT771]|nr:helix-turn-helix domain-containing protein [Flavitalea sp. BT771]MDO6430852.1 helix-turn-helix domain-containing protein [Flavitalea sp. BT771]